MQPAGGGVDIGGSISYGWNKFTANIGPLIVAVLFIFVVNALVGGVASVFNSFILQIMFQLVGIAVGAVVSFGLHQHGPQDRPRRAGGDRRCAAERRPWSSRTPSPASS